MICKMKKEIEEESPPIDLKMILKLVIKMVAPGFSPTNENLSLISSKLQRKTYKKGDFFVKEGEVSSLIGIILSQESVLKAYTLNEEDGEKKVSRIFYSPDNLIVSSFESFKTRTPSMESIVAVTDDILILGIDHDDLQHIYKEIPAFNAMGRVLAERSYITVLKKYREMQSLSGKKRVESFYEHSKQLINKVDAQDIASYLGLSRNKYSEYIKEISARR